MRVLTFVTHKGVEKLTGKLFEADVGHVWLHEEVSGQSQAHHQAASPGGIDEAVLVYLCMLNQTADARIVCHHRLRDGTTLEITPEEARQHMRLRQDGRDRRFVVWESWREPTVDYEVPWIAETQRTVLEPPPAPSYTWEPIAKKVQEVSARRRSRHLPGQKGLL